MNTRRDENPLHILTNYGVESYNFPNFGHLAKGCQLSSMKQEEEDTKICGITLYSQKEDDKWYLDCGCTRHVIGYKMNFLKLKKEMPRDISCGNDESIKIMGKGTMTFMGKEKDQNVLYVEGSKHDLVSVEKICDANYILTFYDRV